MASTGIPERRHPEHWKAGSLLTTGLIFAGVTAFGLYRIRLGIGLTDEGLYLSAPTRYALGDLPLRDEYLNPLRMFDVVLWPLFRLLPEITVLQLRFLWLAVEIGAALALFDLLKRFAPAPLVALGCGATIYLANFIWTPGYHTMGVFFFVLSWSLWLRACLLEHRAAGLVLGSLSGAIFFVATLSYLPLLAVAAIPAMLLASEFVRRSVRGVKASATAAHLLALLLGSLLVLAWLSSKGLTGDWAHAYAWILSTAQYDSTLTDKLYVFFAETRPQLPVLAIGWLLSVALLALGSSSRRIFSGSVATGAVAVVVPLVVLAALFLVDVSGGSTTRRATLPFVTRPFSILCVALGLGIGAALGEWRGRGGREMRDRDPQDGDWRLVFTVLLSGSTLLAFLHGFLSGMAFKSMFATLPLFVISLVGLHRLIARGPGGGHAEVRAALVCGGIAVAAGVGSYSVALERGYGDARLASLTATFSQPRLAGIWSQPGRVRDLDRLVAHLVPRLERGERLLVSGHAPLLYYLTQTRPALDHTWTAPQISPATRQLSIDRMVAAGRIPRFAVRALTRRKIREPVHRFIADRYTLEARIGSYEVWRTPASTNGGLDRRS